jgi:CheY-like chemotaxis protein
MPVPNQRRVLVIDDNQDAANMTCALLKLDGHLAEAAYDGERGVKLVEAFRPESVLVDIGLPGMDGYQVAKAIRSLPLPVLPRLFAITGYAYLEQHIARAGFDGYSLKPVSSEKLRELLEK